MNIYKENDYRKILRSLVEERKKIDATVNFQAMAEFCGCPKSYLSKVLAGQANLNSDQIFLACDYLTLKEMDRCYISLLLESERTEIPGRKKILEKEIAALKVRCIESKEHITADIQSSGKNDVYYYDPLNQIVHLCLSVEKFRRNPMRIAPALKTAPSKIIRAIDTLEELGYIERMGDEILVRENHIHLARTAKVYKTWRNELKLASIAHLNQSSEDEDYSFSVIFSGNTEARESIRQLFLKFLKETEDIVKKAPSESVYQMSFDLFEWTKEFAV